MASFTITTEADEALAAATAETLLILAGDTGRIGKIYEYGVSFDGVSATAEPVTIEILRGNSASQGTSTAATEELLDPSSEAALCDGFHSFTAEPTYTGQALHRVLVHPQGGIFVWQARDDDSMILLDKATNSFIGMRATAPAVVNTAAWLSWKE